MEYKLHIAGKQIFDEYILVAPGSDYARAMWRDIEFLENGVILDNVLRPTNRIFSFLHHVHFSFVINRRVHLPFQYIWKPLYSIEKIQFDLNKKYCVIFTDISAARTDCKYLENLSKRENINLVLVMVNTMARRIGLMEKKFPYFTTIFSFDEKDCEKYGFIYHPTNYSMVREFDKQPIKYDAFYVGVSKGRANLLTQIFNTLNINGANAEFYISGIKKNEKHIRGIHYNKWLSYQQILHYIQESNCIVEVMDGKQKGVTLRTMEAICYNKKLLTNNSLMKKSKYYKTGNIQVFSDPDKIDVEFVKRKDKVDYAYNGEFSPIHLLEHINYEYMNKEIR